MERFVKGDIVVVPFPFSDLTQMKRRPALVLAVLDGDDMILCQITSHTLRDRYAIPVTNTDLDIGNLMQASNVRPNRLFTIDRHIVLYKVDALKREKITEVIEKTIKILKE